MALSPLVIRNLTSVQVNLKSIEKFHAPGTLPNGGRGTAKNFTSIITGKKTQRPPIQPNFTALDPIDSHEVSISIAPFEKANSDIVDGHSVTFFREASDFYCFTFEIDNQKYRIDLPSPHIASLSLKPLVPDPAHEITAIITPAPNPQMTLHHSSHLDCWMKNLKDATPLSALSIPGTHNSATCYYALPSVRCQAVHPREQLANGVRFFDVRVQVDGPDKPQLTLVHSFFPISFKGPKRFHKLIDLVHSFLSEHPSETIVMSIKREGTGSGTDAQLSRILAEHYASGENTARWYVDPKIPTLGQARGKIVLMRRFCIDPKLQAAHDGRGWAIDAECWAENTPHDLHGNVCVQDFYEVLETENVDKKIEYCCRQLERASECICHLPGITTDRENPVPPQPFYLNFLSASNFWKVGCWPEKIAKKLNPAATRWLCLHHHVGENCHGDGGTGIVVCDWVGAGGDWDLVRCIVGMNTRLMIREMELKK